MSVAAPHRDRAWIGRVVAAPRTLPWSKIDVLPSVPSTLELTDLPRALAFSIAPESRLIQDLWTERVLFPTPGHRALRCGPRGGFRL